MYFFFFFLFNSYTCNDVPQEAKGNKFIPGNWHNGSEFLYLDRKFYKAYPCGCVFFFFFFFFFFFLVLT